MRIKYWFIKVGAVAGVCLFALLSGISHASVFETLHDLSVTGGTGAGGHTSGLVFATDQVCVFCHTPHGQNNEVRAYTGYAWGEIAYYNTSGAIGTTGPMMLLWNRALSNAPASKGANPSAYELYTSSTMDAPGDSVRIYSLLCLSCHDGVMAMNVMTNPPQQGELDIFDANGYPESVNYPSGYYQLGEVYYEGGAFGWGANIGERDPSSDTGVVNLSNDHPISIDYKWDHDDVTRGGLWNPGNPPDGTVRNSQLRLFYSPDTGQLTSIECSTCHEPHNQGGLISEGGDGKYPFLAESVENSGLCLWCHLK